MGREQPHGHGGGKSLVSIFIFCILFLLGWFYITENFVIRSSPEVLRDANDVMEEGPPSSEDAAASSLNTTNSETFRSKSLQPLSYSEQPLYAHPRQSSQLNFSVEPVKHLHPNHSTPRKSSTPVVDNLSEEPAINSLQLNDSTQSKSSPEITNVLEASLSPQTSLGDSLKIRSQTPAEPIETADSRNSSGNTFEKKSPSKSPSVSDLGNAGEIPKTYGPPLITPPPTLLDSLPSKPKKRRPARVRPSSRPRSRSSPLHSSPTRFEESPGGFRPSSQGPSPLQLSPSQSEIEPERVRSRPSSRPKSRSSPLHSSPTRFEGSLAGVRPNKRRERSLPLGIPPSRFRSDESSARVRTTKQQSLPMKSASHGEQLARVRPTKPRPLPSEPFLSEESKGRFGPPGSRTAGM